MPDYNVQDHRLFLGAKAVPFKETPNQGGIIAPRFLVMHFTAGRDAASSIEWFRDPSAKASAHLVIGRDGAVTQLVDFNRAAWHAGKSRWGALEGLNAYSIGIELDNAGKLTALAGGGWKAWFGGNYPDDQVLRARHKNEPDLAGWQIFPPAQMEAAKAVGAAIARAYGLEDVLGHDDIAPGRKNDPGPAFPMDSFKSYVLGRVESDAGRLWFTSVDGLNLRAAPSSTAAKVVPDGLPVGTPVRPTGPTSGDWWRVEVEAAVNGDADLEGWVASRFLAEHAPERSLARGPAAYAPPASSAAVLAGVPFAKAAAVGESYLGIWSAADAGSDDPSNCRALLLFPNGTLFFDTKLAIDADGSPRATEIDPWGQAETSLRYLTGAAKGRSLDAEHVPYFVLPLPDKQGNDSLPEDFGIQLGDLGLIVHKGVMVGAICGDKGPHKKIGEASIRVHELLPVPSPWRNPAKKDVLRNSSVEGGVLCFVFPGTSGILDELTPDNAEALITQRALECLDRLRA